MSFTSRACNRRLVAWLSLFAMLLVVCGPAIGQASAALRHHAMPAGMMMHVGMESRAIGAGHHVDTAGLHDQCGYCSLFGHFPVLAEASGSSTPDGAIVSAPRVPEVLASQASTTTFPNALTRAPPRFYRHA